MPSVLTSYAITAGEVRCALLPRPVIALSGKVIDTVACGTNHSCAIDRAGKLYSFGSNDSGQLG